jgi:hypothetical protein
MCPNQRAKALDILRRRKRALWHRIEHEPARIKQEHVRLFDCLGICIPGYLAAHHQDISLRTNSLLSAMPVSDAVTSSSSPRYRDCRARYRGRQEKLNQTRAVKTATGRNTRKAASANGSPSDIARMGSSSSTAMKPPITSQNTMYKREAALWIRHARA